jgi:hypothetical protein
MALTIRSWRVIIAIRIDGTASRPVPNGNNARSLAVKQTVDPKNIDEAKSRIDMLDLDCIKVKLMDSDEGEGWDRETVERLDREYRRFLFLTVTRPESIVPSKEVDAFWHAHILDTQKYAADCEHMFGFFVHHFPYFGMRGDEDAQNLKHAFASTQTIYEEVYGEPYPEAASADCENCGNCTSTCGVCSASGKYDMRERPTLEPVG